MIFHYLAIDTASAVIAWALLAAGLTGGGDRPFLLALTGSGVWLVYIADRWLDSFPESTEDKKGPRHYFMADHREYFAIAWLIVWVVAAGFGLLFLDSRSLIIGALAAALGVGYLIFIQQRSSRSESGKLRAGGGLVVGILVATATCLFPMIEGDAEMSKKVVIWALITWAFFLQCRATRFWENGQNISIPNLMIQAVIVGALGMLVSGLLPIAVATIVLATGILVIDRLPLKDRVSAADWALAFAGVSGWLVTL